jgi:hypothetical protein
LLIFLTLLILVLPGINGRYVFAEERSLTEKNIETKIIEDEMQQLKSRIWLWEGRIQRRPDNLSPRVEIIKLREKYLKLLDSYIKKQEKKLDENPNDTNTIEKKMELLEEKKDLSIKLKSDYIQCIDLNIKELGNIESILRVNPEKINNIWIQFFDSDDLHRRLIEIRREFSRSNGGPQRAAAAGEEGGRDSNSLITSTITFINQKRVQDTNKRIKYGTQWDKEIQSLEAKSLKVKKDFTQLLDEYIQQVEAKLKKNPNDKPLMEKLKKLEDQKTRIKE